MIANFETSQRQTMIFPLRRFLFDPRLPLWKYCLIAWPVMLLPSLVLLTVVAVTLGALGIDVQAFKLSSKALTVTEFFGTVVVAPVIETLCLAGLLAILSSAMPRVGWVALTSALIFGLLHAGFSALWFFGVVWSFFVVSCAYLHWRKQSFGKAYLAALVPHALVNATAMFGQGAFADS